MADLTLKCIVLFSYYFFILFFLPNVHRETIFEKAELQFSDLPCTASLRSHILFFTDGFCVAEENVLVSEDLLD